MVENECKNARKDNQVIDGREEFETRLNCYYLAPLSTIIYEC